MHVKSTTQPVKCGEFLIILSASAIKQNTFIFESYVIVVIFYFKMKVLLLHSRIIGKFKFWIKDHTIGAKTTFRPS